MPDKQKQLDSLRKKILAIKDLPLGDTATNLVFGKGNAEAKIFFIGEAPGEQEDKQGIPFVGRAGKFLDALLSSIGLTLDDVYVANILKYRPPDNRNPNPYEIQTHTPFLIEQIKMVQPQIIVPLGNFATKFVLAGFDCEKMDTIPGIMTIHGRLQEIHWGNLVFSVIPVPHPSAALHNPAVRGVLQEDFQKINKFIRNHPKH